MRFRTQAAIFLCAVAGLASATALAADEEAPKRSVIEGFIGLSDGEVTRRLGKPTLAAHEPPAQMWRYSLDDCTLYLFLYAREGERAPQVLHAEFTYPDGARVKPRACLAGGVRSGP